MIGRVHRNYNKYKNINPKRGDYVEGSDCMRAALVVGVLLVLCLVALSALVISSHFIYPFLHSGFHSSAVSCAAESGEGVLGTPTKYYLRVVTVSIDGKLLGSETVELSAPPIPVGQTVKRVQLREVVKGDVIVLTPVIRDCGKVKSAIMKIWRLPAEGGGLVIDLGRLPPPNATINVLSGEIRLVRNDGRAVMIVLEVEYLDGSADSFGYAAVGFDVAPSTAGSWGS